MANGNGNGSLTGLQQAFVDEYLGNGFNATQAARDAGYQGDDNTLAVMGHENLRKPKIRQQIEQRLAGRAMEADEVLMRLAEQARGSLEAFMEFTDHGWRVNVEKAQQAGLLHLAKKIKGGKYGLEIELYDAQAALIQIGKAHGLWVEKQEHEVGDRLASVLEEIREARAREDDAGPGSD